MQLKTCKNCQKDLIPNEDLFRQNVYVKSNFSKKLFCNNSCRNNYYNKIKIKNYLLKDTEHNNFIKDINKVINGDILVVSTGKVYNPDITKGNVDYEIELYRDLYDLKNKVSRWDKMREHILIICISELTTKLFDETYIYNGK